MRARCVVHNRSNKCSERSMSRFALCACVRACEKERERVRECVFCLYDAACDRANPTQLSSVLPSLFTTSPLGRCVILFRGTRSVCSGVCVRICE